jgi:hypothetical protein
LGLDELAFEVEASLALFFELDADGFEFNFDLVELGFEEGAAALVVFGAAPGRPRAGWRAGSSSS